MSFFAILVGVAGFCLVLWDFCKHLPPEQVPKLRRWFGNWLFKGFITPCLLWIFFNSSLCSWLPPLVQSLDFARSNGNWPEVMREVAEMGAFYIGTFWMAVTAGWLLVVLAKQTDDPAQVRGCVIIWTALTGPVAVFIIWIVGWRMAGLAAIIWLLPMLHHLVSMQSSVNVTPIYSRAIAAMHFDKYEEAEQAVIQELETCENDFDGWMLLAELYANHFHDLPGARDLIIQTCEHPGTTPSQFAVACHRLADWQLKLGQDPVAARSTLEAICRRHPASHLDRMARLRMNQLPATSEEWIAQQGVKKIRMQTLRAAPLEEMTRPEAFARSQECVERLHKNPDDVAAREMLARLWAEELDQVEMGVEQVELLLAMPGRAPEKAAEWLALMASWHLRFPPNPAAARAVLQRLVGRYPRTPHGFAAQRRLNVMDLESKLRQSTATREEPAH